MASSRIDQNWYWPVDSAVELIDHLWEAGSSDDYLASILDHVEGDYDASPNPLP